MSLQSGKISETVFYKQVTNKLSEILVKEYELTNDDFHIVRIESPSTPGVPDINVCVKDIHGPAISYEFWIECKVYPGVLGSYQIAWKKKRELAGGRVFVVTYINECRIEIKDVFEHMTLHDAVKYILREVGL